MCACVLHLFWFSLAPWDCQKHTVFQVTLLGNQDHAHNILFSSLCFLPLCLCIMASTIDHTYLVLSKDRTDKICRLVPRCLGLNTVFFVVATWLTKASTNSELQKQLARNIGLAFIIFYLKRQGNFAQIEPKKGGVKHNRIRNAIIILHPPFWARIESNPCK